MHSLLSMKTIEAQPDSGSLIMRFLCTEFGLHNSCLRGLNKFKKNTLMVGNNT